MDEKLIIIIAAGGFGLILILVLLIAKCYCARRRAYYNIPDNYSVIGSEVNFKGQSKTGNTWIGTSGLDKMQQEAKLEKQRKIHELYSAAMRTATNYCRGSLHQRKIRDDLPCIGYRNEIKFYFPVLDEKLQKEVSGDGIMMIHIDLTKCPVYNPIALDRPNDVNILGACRIINFDDDEQFRAFRLTLQSLDNTYICKTYEVGVSRDKLSLFLFRDLQSSGSLRDLIYNVKLNLTYEEKYYHRTGKPFSLSQIRKYGRHILEGMKYLSSCGIVNYHLHTGNIIIHNDIAKISGYENNFLGLLIKAPYHKYLLSLKKLYKSQLNIELCLFSYILFEMATGTESPKPCPVDCFHEVTKIPPPIKDVITKIFSDNTSTLDDIIQDPIFQNIDNIHSIDATPYIKLKNENTIVEKIRNASAMQCLKTYADDNNNNTKTTKKKKKNKKIKSDNNNSLKSDNDNNNNNKKSGDNKPIQQYLIDINDEDSA